MKPTTVISLVLVCLIGTIVTVAYSESLDRQEKGRSAEIESAWSEARERNCRAQAFKLANMVNPRFFTTGPVERAYEECLK